MITRSSRSFGHRSWLMNLFCLLIIVTSSLQVGNSALVASPPALKKKINPRDGLVYVWISPGTFEMGCSESDHDCSDGENPRHSVTITKGFWIGETEVTQAALDSVFPQTLRNRFEGPEHPVDSASWDDAKAYCDAVGMRLPTEAEYEYAARAGSEGPRYGPLVDIAWFSANSHGHSQVIGKLSKNDWELYDMLGNVWEWVNDWYGTYKKEAQTDPQGPSSGYSRVLRGGSANLGFSSVRVSARLVANAESRGGSDYFGFRCAANEPVSW
jgi:sulfatase modifying factor 1